MGDSVNGALDSFQRRGLSGFSRTPKIGSKFALVPMKIEQIADIVGISREQLKPILDNMANKGLVMDFPRRETSYYMLAPMVIGFFEYTFMRVRDEVNMRDLAQLFHSYFQNREAREEFSGINTRMMRTLVYEKLIPVAVETEVLTYERASEIIRQAGWRSTFHVCLPP